MRAHIRCTPARTTRVGEDVSWSEFARKNAGIGIDCCLGDAIAGVWPSFFLVLALLCGLNELVHLV